MNCNDIKTPIKMVNKAILSTCLGLCILVQAPTVFAKITLVYTSNQPDISLSKNVAHFPQLGTLLKKLRAIESNNTLFLHGGDSFSPSAISLFDKANNIISLANIMDVSLYSVGKRELTYDVDVLSLRALDAQFPIVSNNILDSRTNDIVEGLFPSYRFNIDDTSIAISSVINPRTLVSYAPEFVKLVNMDESINRIVQEQSDADIKILMTDLELAASMRIAKQQKFDLILIANDGVDEIILEDKTTLVLGGGQDGDTVIIELDKLKSQKVSARIEDLSKHRPDSEIIAFVDKYKLRLSSINNEYLATAQSDFTTQKSLVRTQQNSLASVFADALKVVAKSEIAIVNSGSIRNSAQYKKGHKFTRGDIQKEFPFGGYYVVIEVSGTQIMDIMENSFSRIEHTDGRFLHLSGMKVTYDSTAAIGNRVKSIEINGDKLSPSTVYTMAMQDFYLKGGDGYTMLKGKVPINNLFSKGRMWNIVADYFAKQKKIQAPNADRLIDISMP